MQGPLRCGAANPLPTLSVSLTRDLALSNDIRPLRYKEHRIKFLVRSKTDRQEQHLTCAPPCPVSAGRATSCSISRLETSLRGT